MAPREPARPRAGIPPRRRPVARSSWNSIEPPARVAHCMGMRHLILVLLSLAGCAATESYHASTADRTASELAPAAKAPAVTADAATDIKPPQADPAAAPAVDRVVIYTGHVQL